MLRTLTAAPKLSAGLLAGVLAGTLAACGGGTSQPEHPTSQLAFGTSMAQRGLWSEALFRFHEAERLDPENPHIHNNLGVAYEATGEFDKALQHYQKALKLAPQDRAVRNNYARFVEFYQGFRPKQAKEKGLGAALATRQAPAGTEPPAEGDRAPIPSGSGLPPPPPEVPGVDPGAPPGAPDPFGQPPPPPPPAP